jgi:hypothetical protein
VGKHVEGLISQLEYSQLLQIYRTWEDIDTDQLVLYQNKIKELWEKRKSNDMKDRIAECKRRLGDLLGQFDDPSVKV